MGAQEVRGHGGAVGPQEVRGSKGKVGKIRNQEVRREERSFYGIVF